MLHNEALIFLNDFEREISYYNILLTFVYLMAKQEGNKIKYLTNSIEIIKVLVKFVELSSCYKSLKAKLTTA